MCSKREGLLSSFLGNVSLKWQNDEKTSCTVQEVDENLALLPISFLISSLMIRSSILIALKHKEISNYPKISIDAGAPELASNLV